ncbi:MAG: hypothetical protein HFJ54_06805 [Clostridia bacterium]|nr:hypothetical protein [Clostridia bacterium]
MPDDKKRLFYVLKTKEGFLTTSCFIDPSMLDGTLSGYLRFMRGYLLLLNSDTIGGDDLSKEEMVRAFFQCSACTIPLPTETCSILVYECPFPEASFDGRCAHCEKKEECGIPLSREPIQII